VVGEEEGGEMSDTPRMDSAAGHARGIVDAAILAEGIKLERELNRACEMYRKLDIHTLNLVDRISRLEKAGDAIANTQTYDLLETVNWRKAKEANP
jgi:hypothetical protein